VRQVAVVFWVYLVLIFAGIAVYTIVGATHN